MSARSQLCMWMYSSPNSPRALISLSYLHQEEVDAEGGESPRQFDVEHLGVDVGRAGQLLVLGDHLLLDPPALHPRHGEQGRQAAGRGAGWN